MMTTTLTRASMPPMDRIVQWWMTNEPDVSKARYIGWGEPFCFRCGWLAPVPDTQDPMQAWRRSSGWLERAHLVNLSTGEPDANEPWNLVPVCVLCHVDMSDTIATRDEYAKAVRVYTDWQSNQRSAWWQLATDMAATTNAEPMSRGSIVRLYRSVVGALTDSRVTGGVPE